MARVAYTDLFLNFTPDTTHTPTQTQIGLLIKNYYRQAYNLVYGMGTYNDTDSDTTDPKTIIRSDEFFGEVVGEISTKVQKWHDSGISSSGEIVPMPSMSMSKELREMLKIAAGRTYDRIANIRCWGHDYDMGDMI